MSENSEVEQIKAVLAAFFQGLDTRDGETIRHFWHDDARLFLNSAVLTTRSLTFLLALPDQMNFQVQRIEHVDVHGLVAMARVDYRVSAGRHTGFFNLVKASGRWRIANWVDHGVARLN